MKTIRIATRQSALALWQTRFIAQKLQALYPSIQIELVGLTTTGDKITDRPLAAIGGKALFVKELEQALLLDQADIAVHSLKDVPADLTPGFELAAICEREDPRDAFLSVNYADLMALPKQAKVGTSSYRRKAQLLATRSDLQIFDLRGNVDTRIRKLKAGEYDAIILAYAGVKRLGLVEEVKQILPVEISLPAAGQGAVAVECLANKPELQALLLPLNHVETRACVLAERSMNQRLQGDCYSPIGSFAEVIAGELQLRGLVASADGKVLLRTSQKGKPALAETIGRQAAEDLLAQGAKAVLCSH